MKFINFLLNTYVNTSVHVAFAVCSLVGVTCLEYDINIAANLLGFVFFGTVTGYNFVKYAAVTTKRYNELRFHLKVIQLVSVIALLYFSFQLSWVVLIFFGSFAILTFLYAIPLLKNKNLRNLTGIKITIVAFVWAGVTVLIPIINEGVFLDLDIWLTFFQRFLFVFVLTLPFEIRDLQYDESSLETLPQRVGVKKTKVTGVVMLVLVLLLELFKDSIKFNDLVSLGIIIIVLLVFLLNSKKKQSKYFSSFWVESIPVLWFGIISFLQFYFDIS
tara:strand:+ start:4674 stop:5495 length:822 start_codon:yes stop_codon:yes gene_type:complete